MEMEIDYNSFVHFLEELGLKPKNIKAVVKYLKTCKMCRKPTTSQELSFYDKIVKSEYGVQYMAMHMSNDTAFMHNIVGYLLECNIQGTCVSLGCGIGARELFLAQCCKEMTIHAYDMSAGQIAVAKKLQEKCGVANVQFHTQDYVRQPIKGRFPVVFSMHGFPLSELPRTEVRGI